MTSVKQTLILADGGRNGAGTCSEQNRGDVVEKGEMVDAPSRIAIAIARDTWSPSADNESVRLAGGPQ